MTGLNLGPFLQLVRTGPGGWAGIALMGAGLLALGALGWRWGWGRGARTRSRSRRMLRRCLIVSLAAHLGLALYGSTVPAVQLAFRGRTGSDQGTPHIRRIQVRPLAEEAGERASEAASANASTKGAEAVDGPASSTRRRLEMPAAPLRLADASLKVRAPRPPIAEPSGPGPRSDAPPPAPIAVPNATPPPTAPSSADPPPIAPLAEPPRTATRDAPPLPQAAMPPDLNTVAPDLPSDPRSRGASSSSSSASRESQALDRALGGRDRALRADVRSRLRAGANRAGSPNGAAGPLGPAPASLSGPTAAPEAKPGDSATKAKPSDSATAPVPDERPSLPLEPVTPGTVESTAETASAPALARLTKRPTHQRIEVPRVYRQRLAPNRPIRARRDGASAASELAVERALDWLARHQDDDGRWNAGIARYANGTPDPKDADFTAHCPPGEACFGQCAYWEADTALTGLALLTYLGAGHTHIEGQYSDTIGKGFDFLMGQQRPDGDLRGASRVVGMYCHAMATLALCEGHALTGDERIRAAAERAIGFLVRSRARDGLAWRYAPGAPIGDTSILGWVVLGLKSAKETGVFIPNAASVRRGTLGWLDRVAAGKADGLARYQPGEQVTPTMTAEAWVCRQFLGVGGPGPASDEAAAYLLDHPSDRGTANFYYWYYATLALYQHGGTAWTRWNAALRDKIVGLQVPSGHQSGSWPPDDSLYGAKGGRIYCTALAAMTLEVYYRYLRLYDAPSVPPAPELEIQLGGPRPDPETESEAETQNENKNKNKNEPPGPAQAPANPEDL